MRNSLATLGEFIDHEVETALKTEADNHRLNFNEEEVEVLSTHVWEYYTSKVDEDEYELDLRGRTFDDILDSYREDRLSDYYESRIG